MNTQQVFAFVSMIIILAIAIFMHASAPNNQTDQSDTPPSKNGESSDDKDPNTENNKVYWGVDSASYTDENLYQCVEENFGQPEVWGRYLGTIEDVSEGLDANEVNYLHENDARILVIYNHFNDATGYDQGVEEAKKAITYAEDLGIPKGVAIFGDIEPSYPVDSAFIEGWFDTLSASAYEPALYGVFNEDSSLSKAYNATNQDIQKSTVIWTAYPQEEITTKENAPAYNPQGPSDSLLYGWQYAIDAEQCNIDTNLFSEKILDYLW